MKNKCVSDNIKFKVCVRCKTYNHAPYIEDALNGFCMQNTMFPFVCVIVDDASTDGEQKVIGNYIQENFDVRNAIHEENDNYILKFVRHKNNLNCYFAIYYLKYNHWRWKSTEPYILRWQEKSNFVALCEGDDYWIDPMKLQAQVDYMEEHPDCGMVYTKIRILVQSKNEISEVEWARDCSFEDMLLSNEVQTLTVCARRDLFDEFYALSDKIVNEKQWLMGDYPLWLFFFAESSTKFIGKITAVYRVLENSASHSVDFSERERFIINSMDISLYFAKRYNKMNMIPSVVKRNVEIILRESDSRHKNTKTLFLPIFLKYRIYNPTLLILALSSHNRKLRKYCKSFLAWYHKIKKRESK